MIGNGIEHLACAGQVLIERRRVLVEADEPEPGTLLEARHLQQIVEAPLVEALAVAILGVLVEELAGAAVGPAVVRTDEALAVSPRLAADRCAAMTAGIEEGVDTPVHIAIEDQLAIHDEADDEVPLVRHLAVMAEHDP